MEGGLANLVRRDAREAWRKRLNVDFLCEPDRVHAGLLPVSEERDKVVRLNSLVVSRFISHELPSQIFIDAFDDSVLRLRLYRHLRDNPERAE